MECLPPDEYLKDGGRYRTRRHACFVADGDALEQVPHRAHWQPVEYNALHGGMQRWFAPMEPHTVMQPVWQALMRRLAQMASGLRGTQKWFIEEHQFRIDTAGGIGTPTPKVAPRRRRSGGGGAGGPARHQGGETRVSKPAAGAASASP